MISISKILVIIDLILSFMKLYLTTFNIILLKALHNFIDFIISNFVMFKDIEIVQKCYN